MTKEEIPSITIIDEPLQEDDSEAFIKKIIDSRLKPKEEIPLSPEELAIGENAMINEEVQREKANEWKRRYALQKLGFPADEVTKPYQQASPGDSLLIDRIISELQALKSKLGEEGKNV